jgi:hypothetical protein
MNEMAVKIRFDRMSDVGVASLITEHGGTLLKQEQKGPGNNRNHFFTVSFPKPRGCSAL